MLPQDTPFVLLDDARRGGGDARLFTDPLEIIEARALDEVATALERVRAGLKRGLYAAGWIGYEAGLALEPRLRATAREEGDGPLLWFGLFERVERLPAAALEALLPDARGAWLTPPRPRIERAAYGEAFARAHAYIKAGDIYQVNLSYRADLEVLGHPLAAYAQVRAAGQGGWSAVVHDGARWLLSTSPELFFQVRDGVAEARPMKGTAKRGLDVEADRRAAAALQNDPKERAENVMIVDLLRNDLSRIAKRGSVRTPALFAVETYPTLHTLTSTVRADVRDECDAIDVLRALFPCGSITGAPKIRAMEIIGELERDRRGVYTGAIGWMGPDGEAGFNVAIRTLTLADGKAELGVGSAVIYDSDVDAEWDECRVKSAFVTANAPRFELLETMRFEPGAGIARFDLHKARLQASARTLGFAFDAATVESAVERALATQGEACAVRLTLTRDGQAAVTLRAAPAAGALVDVLLAPLPVRGDDVRLRHKTTDRAFYDDARAASGADEVVFVDADGFLTEGSFTNVFVERDGVLLTPEASRGLLPGVLRAELLAQGRAREAALRAADLADGFYLGNALRGLMPARLQASVRKTA